MGPGCSVRRLLRSTNHELTIHSVSVLLSLFLNGSCSPSRRKAGSPRNREGGLPSPRFPSPPSPPSRALRLLGSLLFKSSPPSLPWRCRLSLHPLLAAPSHGHAPLPLPPPVFEAPECALYPPLSCPSPSFVSPLPFILLAPPPPSRCLPFLLPSSLSPPSSPPPDIRGVSVCRGYPSLENTSIMKVRHPAACGPPPH